MPKNKKKYVKIRNPYSKIDINFDQNAHPIRIHYLDNPSDLQGATENIGNEEDNFY
ncbi:MAG: hypothetical protein ACI90V_009663 [Bacillariaceae sp.]|jgi:hypothetical protein